MAGGAAGDDRARGATSAAARRSGRAVEHELAVRAGARRSSRRSRVGLLVDLLEHERLVAALLGDLDRVVTVSAARSMGSPPSTAEKRAPSGVITTSSRSPTCLAARVCSRNAGDEGGDERLALAEADHHRALEARADDHLRVERQTPEREVAVQIEEDARARSTTIAVVVRREQVRDASVSVSELKPWPFVGHLLAQLGVVLDDAVEHHREAVVVARERVRVGLRTTPPWVAQRVWPMPVVAGEPFVPATCLQRSTLPTCAPARASRRRRSARCPAES